MNWSQKLSKDDSSFNHFDVGCTMKSFDHSILTVVCIRELDFHIKSLEMFIRTFFGLGTMED
jgi:hypothetical protein